MEFVKQRNILIGVLALLTVAVFSFCWFAASVSDPTWVFGANYLSDLGVSDYTWGHKFFNGGCLVAGVLLAVCGTALIVTKERMLDLIAGLFVLVAGIAMSLIGIVTEDAGDPHIIIALIAFGFGFLGLIIFAFKDWCDGLRILAPLTFIGIIAVIVSYLLFNLDSDVLTPEVETVAMITLLSLFLLQGMKFVYHGNAGNGCIGKHKLAFGFAALLGSVGFLMFWLFAVAADPSWTFASDGVYRLGLSAVGETQNLFALACIIGGFFTAVFGVGFGMMKDGCLRSVSGFFILLAGLIVLGIGMTVLAQKNVYASAEQFAVAFGMITLALLIAADWTKKRIVPAAFYMIVLACGIVTIMIGYDAMSVFCILALFIVLGIEGVRMLLRKN
jgi:hypothetical membrane protein